VYLYTEGGVWNQMVRDRQDMSNNFAGPNARIQAEMLAVALAAAQKGDELDESEREAVKTELETSFHDLRDGIEIEES